MFPDNENFITQDMVNWSQVIVFVQPKIKTDFFQYFTTNNQQIITLDVEDRSSIFTPNKKVLTAAKWQQMQKQYVYSELEKQIIKYLPFIE